MERYRVKPIKEKKNIIVSVPGSKSITNRALMLAAMSNGECTLNGVLFSSDSRAFLDCLINLGFKVSMDEQMCQVVIKGENGNIPNKKATINVQSAGTAARFMTVFLAVAGGDYVLESSEQMKKRPMKELLDSLIEKGAEIKYLENEGHFPFEIHSPGIGDVDMTIDTTTSSQYASALLMASVMNGMKIHLTGSRVNGAYIKITLKMMEQFGIRYDVSENIYDVASQTYKCSIYDIEPDMSAACYFYAMAIILKVKSVVNGIHKDSMQGDIKFLQVLEKMGCKETDTDNGIEIDASGLTDYEGIEIDMSDFSDQALTMAVVAAFAKSDTRIKNIGHIRGQESDRVQVIVTELNRLGCEASIIEENGTTDVVIKPGKLHGTDIETYDDHRVAMSFAMAGLVVDGVIIKNPMCCKKTFENYFDVLDGITD
ncbi:MAG: 3-phosphoshikimate 1-carboxyvinyltransferase [Eubacterium sp.]